MLAHLPGDVTGSPKAGDPWGHPKWCRCPQPWSSSECPLPCRELGRVLPPSLSLGHAGGGSHQPLSSG